MIKRGKSKEKLQVNYNDVILTFSDTFDISTQVFYDLVLTYLDIL